MGEGVNVASRLEAMAEPGGLAVSAEVMAQVRGKTDVLLEDQGFQRLKETDAPIHVYKTRSKNVAGGGFFDFDEDALSGELITGGCRCGDIRYEIDRSVNQHRLLPLQHLPEIHWLSDEHLDGFSKIGGKLRDGRARLFWIFTYCRARVLFNLRRQHCLSSAATKRGGASCPVHPQSRSPPKTMRQWRTAGLRQRCRGSKSSMICQERKHATSRVLQKAWSSVGVPDPSNWGPMVKPPEVF